MDVSVDNEVIVNTNGTVEVAVGNAADAVVADDHALDITVTKKEYKIVGDEVYIAKLYEDAPQWMKDLVQLVVDNTMVTESAALLNNLVSQLNQFATSYVPLNTYTQSILDLSNADTAMHATLETLNSNFNDGLNTANSQIIDLQSTKASKTEVATKVIETLTAQLATPTSELGATIGNLQQTIIDGDSANADSITTLMSTLEGEVDARATAVQALDTRVTDVKNLTTSQATAITNLTTEVSNGTNTWAAADSSVVNSLTTAINNGDAAVQAKWAYNSTVAINGVYKKSGFGLTSNYSGGSGTENDPYVSEFWIDATKLKFTNSNATGRTAPFTIDASGVTPQITFNGRVSFSNVTNVPQLGSTPQQVVDAVNAGSTTTIDGGKITTGSIAADKIAANTITADRFTSTTGQSSVWTGGGLVSQNFNGNVVGSIGTPTQGFRLSSNAAGTSSDPNIYGAYIKGATLEGTTMSTGDIRVSADGYPANYGPIMLFEAYNNGTTNTSSIFRSRGYSSGYNSKRMCSTNQMFFLQASTSGSYSYDGNVTEVTIYVSVNGGTWTTLISDAYLLGYVSCSIVYVADSSSSVQFMSTHSSRTIKSTMFSIQSINGPSA